MRNKILYPYLILAISFSGLIAMDDKPDLTFDKNIRSLSPVECDENVTILRSGRRIPKTTSDSCSLLQTYTSQVADDEAQVKIRVNDNKRRCVGEERRPVKSPAIPPVAQGYEDIYARFLNGKLTFRPDVHSDKGKVELRVADLADPLNGIFNLSNLSSNWYGAGGCVSISTGYKKRYIPESVGKVEVWITPRFLIEKELETTASHFVPIMSNWKPEAAIGLFWTCSKWDDLSWYDYLTTQTMDEISNNDLYQNWTQSKSVGVNAPRRFFFGGCGGWQYERGERNVVANISYFTFHF